ncbi:MAG TPA: A24 family peptidase [Vicinamibacterales bacterium]|nr:A24 family peptidase [Vicinamibacterales bacterium]
MLKISDPIAVVVVCAAGLASTAIDLRTRRIPNALTVSVAAGGVIAAACGRSGVSPAAAIAALAIGLAMMLPAHVAGATGAGDVKLFAAIATWLGPRATLFAFVYTAVAGGAIALVVAMRRRILRATLARTAALVTTAGSNVGDIERGQLNRFAYAPAIAIGALAAALGM